MGIKNILNAVKIVIYANGRKKREAINPLIFIVL